MIEKQHLKWWSSARVDHEGLKSYVKSLDESQRDERFADYVHGILYGNEVRHNRELGSAMRFLRAGNSPVKLNVTRSCVDTVKAKIGKNFVSVKVTADDADWTQKRKARDLSRFIRAKMTRTRFREMAPNALRDAAITGTGIVKVYPLDGEICCELVPKRELLVDAIEGRYGKPRQIHQRKLYDRAYLKALFPKKKVAIAQCPAADPSDFDDWLNGDDCTADMVEVWESVRIKSRKGAEDGKRVIWIDNEILHEERWDYGFPYAFIHWSPPETGKGFWGTGLCAELAPIQYEIDQTAKVLQRGFKLGAPLKVFVDRNAKIGRPQITSEVGAIIPTSARDIKIGAPQQPVSQQQLEWLFRLMDQAYAISGISQLSAQAKLPANIESSVAIQSYYDIETERFSQVANAYANFYVDVAALFIETARRIAKESPEYTANYKGKGNLLRKIKWSNVNMEEDHYVLELEPQNFLKDLSVGKMEIAQQLIQGGIVPPHWVGALFENPDIARFWKMTNAAFYRAEDIIEKCEDVNAPLPEIDAFIDQEIAVKMVTAAYNDAVVDGAPEEVQQRFRDVLKNAEAKAKEAKEAAAAAQPQMPAADPMAQGMGDPLMPQGAPEGLAAQALPNAPGMEGL